MAMLNLDPWNMLWTVVNLLVLYVIFKKFMYQPIMNIIHAREQMIKQQFDKAQKDQENAFQMKVDYEKKLESAKLEASQIVLDARERAAVEHASAVAQTKTETENMLERAKADIVNEQMKATKEAQAEIAQLAILAARKILKTGGAHDTGSSK